MDKEELTEKAQELTIKNVTDGKSKYYSWGHYKGCVVGLEYNNKQIAELEEINADLKQSLDWANERESEDVKRIKDLEKENAELNNFIMQSKKDGISPINALIIKNLGNQLTKAKELLKQWLQTSKTSGCDNINIVTEAEQFLKGVEK